ncbi:alpha/beta hydrolase [Malaciobacter molluscorum]|uniref:alpha/beta fold hydrolase n=1 Tax=Malaciobacter molluscorum TaxID=1032072 RepID=UPI00100AF290|nr:alpha/beta hydrolase [Malaciobacter molluscorum]RXJ96296.1 alpha/beta hydrolase [Malaciobacter molluscorum]
MEIKNYTFKYKNILIDNIEIAYYEEGKGETLILLHGWPQTSYMWRKVIPELSKKYRVITIDLPGLGNSTQVKQYDTKYIATLLDNFRDRLDINDFHLISHDIGSWVASSYYIYFNSYLKSLTVMDAGIPGLIPDELFSLKNANKIWQFYFHFIDEIPEFLVKDREKEYISWYFNKKSYIKNAITEFDINEYYKAYSKNDKMKNGFEYYRSINVSAEQNKIVKNKFKTKILAIGGEYAVGDSISIAMNKISEDVTPAIIKNCGHYIAEEQPEELLKILIPWLKNQE